MFKSLMLAWAMRHIDDILKRLVVPEADIADVVDAYNESKVLEPMLIPATTTSGWRHYERTAAMYAKARFAEGRFKR